MTEKISDLTLSVRFLNIRRPAGNGCIPVEQRMLKIKLMAPDPLGLASNS